MESSTVNQKKVRMRTMWVNCKTNSAFLFLIACVVRGPGGQNLLMRYHVGSEVDLPK